MHSLSPSFEKPRLNVFVKTAKANFDLTRIIFRINIARCELAMIHVQQMIARKRSNLLFLRDLVVMITCACLTASAFIVAYVYAINHIK